MTAPNRDPANRCPGSGQFIPDEGVVRDVGFCPLCGRPVSATTLSSSGEQVGRIVPKHGTIRTPNTDAHDNLLRTRRLP